MKIHVLTYSNPGRLSHSVSTDFKLLKESAKKLGHQIIPVYAKDCQLKFNTRKPQILIKNKRANIKILLVRANFLGGSLDFQAGLIKQFELAGVHVINKHLPVLRAKNKLRNLQTLSKNKVPIPKTYIVRSPDYLDTVIKDIGKFPVIIKTLSGSHGKGVSIVESKRGLSTLIDMIVHNEHSAPLTIQEYVKESKGKDIRVFIVGKRIIAAMERIATKKGEFRSNFHLGGRVRVAEMSAKEKRVAFAAVEACGLDVAGVDLLRTKSGPKVLEVNANPGLEGITQATNRDVAGEILKYTVTRSKRRTNSIEKKKTKK